MILLDGTFGQSINVCVWSTNSAVTGRSSNNNNNAGFFHLLLLLHSRDFLRRNLNGFVFVGYCQISYAEMCASRKRLVLCTFNCYSADLVACVHFNFMAVSLSMHAFGQSCCRARRQFLCLGRSENVNGLLIIRLFSAPPL